MYLNIVLFFLADLLKLFVRENFSKYELIDLDMIQVNIELTRFPVTKDDLHQDTIIFPGLTRGADLIGQLSDPSYLAKLPALFAEFLGYSSSKDLRAGYPRFYWQGVSLYLTDSIRYLEMSDSGCAILANLYGNHTTVEKQLDRFYKGNKTNIFKELSSWLKKR